ncbi:MAG: hypothetical protein ABFC34_11070 [Methanobacterium sp.]
MNKKIIVLIALAMVIVGGYASYYTYASTVIVPDDVKVFKDELKSIETDPIPESDITELEKEANQIQNLPSLKIIPLSERKKMASDMKKDPFFTSMNSTMAELNENITINQEIASRYDIMMKGDVANNIRTIYSEQMVDLMQNMTKTIQKMPSDFESGDNIAIANDLRKLAKIGRDLNKLAAEDKPKLNDIIKSLGG